MNQTVNQIQLFCYFRNNQISIPYKTDFWHRISLEVNKMDLDFILFTPPKSKYSFMDFWGEVIFIPKYRSRAKRQQQEGLLGSFFNCYKSTKTVESHITVEGDLVDVKNFYEKIEEVATDQTTSTLEEEIDGYIPCLYLDSMVRSEYLLIYFHASGQDIHLSKAMLNHLRNSYQINVLAMEYPGYSLYKGRPTTAAIKRESKLVYTYAVDRLGFKPQNIIVMGRSIGTGIALELLQSVRPKALVLISPFSSIKALAKSFVGKLGQILAKETYNNCENVSKVQCPVFILHGKKDELIPYENSIELRKNCKVQATCNFPNSMTHSSFDFYTDLSDPLREFLMNHGVRLYRQNMQGPQVPDWLFKCPESLSLK